jgi:peptidoglycan/xylan/chitin deacetylase (PgdA/CDA1 family)
VEGYPPSRFRAVVRGTTTARSSRRTLRLSSVPRQSIFHSPRALSYNAYKSYHHRLLASSRFARAEATFGSLSRFCPIPVVIGLQRTPLGLGVFRRFPTVMVFAKIRAMLDRLLSWAARHSKAVAGWIIFRTRLYRLLRRNEAVIVVFHRVNDTDRNDPLTYSTRKFEDFVRFFGRFFEVIPLSELLRRLETGVGLAACLVITFDDGYQGNATIAAPILARYGQRACFFVTTSFIGTNFVPWWDAERKIMTRWMSWDHVRSLRASGHEVGSHTETHADLGQSTADEARREIGGGIARLDTELGEHSGLFAYPFGGKENMSEENQSVLKELGLRCSLSAYGGTVRPDDDPLRLKRTTISEWFLTPYHFGFELVAGRLDPD